MRNTVIYNFLQPEFLSNIKRALQFIQDCTLSGAVKCPKTCLPAVIVASMFIVAAMVTELQVMGVKTICTGV